MWMHIMRPKIGNFLLFAFNLSSSTCLVWLCVTVDFKLGPLEGIVIIMQAGKKILRWLCRLFPLISSCILLWTMHYGIRADIKKKNYQEMFNFESWFLCQFSSNTWMFFVEGLLTPQKLENEKIKSQISILGGIKLQKGEGGVFHRQNRSQNFRFYKCYDICFYNFCDKHPLMGKKRF